MMVLLEGRWGMDYSGRLGSVLASGRGCSPASGATLLQAMQDAHGFESDE